MTTKKVALKVHQLAKELNVSSKDIIARCKTEDIEGIETHLSPISMGLAATIREWFGSGGSGTAVATAAPDTEEDFAADASPEMTMVKDAAAPRPASKAAEAAEEASRAARKATRKSNEAPTHAPAPSARAPAPSAPAAPTSTAGAPPSPPTAPTAAPSHGQAHGQSQAKGAPPAPAHRSTHGASTSAPSATPTRAPSGGRGQRGDSGAPAAPAAPTSGHAGRPPQRTLVRPGASASGAPASGAPSAPSGPSRRPLPQRPTARRDDAAGGEQTDATREAGPTGERQGEAPDGRTERSPRVNPQSPPPNFAPYVAPVMNVPKRPDVVKAGPRLEIPTKTTLSGPKVIRIEQAEQLPTPRPRSASSGAGGPMRVGRPGAPGTGPGRPEDRARGGRGATGRRDDASGRTGRIARAGATPEGTGTEPWRQQDLREREDRIARAEGFFKTHRRDSLKKASQLPAGQRQAKQSEGEPIRISEPITIKELSAATGVKSADILKRLFLGGTIATINSAIDSERASEIMMDFDIELAIVEQRSAADIIESRFTDREKVDVQPRAPVVTILGHVDHGKTSLLDKIRNTNVASGEAGGITQATSAFQVPVKAGEKDRVVTFIDTPGHEAFTNMRARGAKVTDIVVLVVAADDGVMPQTVESINHAKAAGVPIVVALNKIDKAEATEPNIRRILGQLAEHELNPVEWGGTTEVVRTSATKGDGVQDLLEILDYQAELLGLTSDFGGTARGTVLEARMEEGRGPVANVIVQEGTLKKGDFVVIGRGFGRVRDIMGDRGTRGAEAIPSTPVTISGIDELPDAGDKFYVVDSLKAAEQAAEERRRLDRERELAAPKITLDNIFQHLQKGQRKELSLVVKADVQGSVETLRAVLAKIGTDEVTVSVKHCAVGGINESDISLAEATDSIIIGFNVTSSAKARSLAEAKGIEIRLYDVIYDVTGDVTKAAAGLLAPEIKLDVLGHAEVRQVFKISKVGMVAGCYVLDGTIERNAQIRVTRDGIVIEKDRRLEQLKRVKDDAKEVRAGQECGMKIVGYDDIKVGDVLECYKTIQVARSL